MGSREQAVGSVTVTYTVSVTEPCSRSCRISCSTSQVAATWYLQMLIATLCLMGVRWEIKQAGAGAGRKTEPHFLTTCSGSDFAAKSLGTREQTRSAWGCCFVLTSHRELFQKNSSSVRPGCARILKRCAVLNMKGQSERRPSCLPGWRLSVKRPLGRRPYATSDGSTGLDYPCLLGLYPTHLVTLPTWKRLP